MPRQCLVREAPQPMTVPELPKVEWSMDFMHDHFADGRGFRLFTVLNDFNRGGVLVGANLSLRTLRVIRALELLVEWRGAPAALRYGNGPENVCASVQQWTKMHGVRLVFIQPGQLQENAYVERYNRTVRYAWLAQSLFDTIVAIQTTNRWLWTYSHERLNMALGGITSAMKPALAASLYFC